MISTYFVLLDVMVVVVVVVELSRVLWFLLTKTKRCLCCFVLWCGSCNEQ